ncbi:MAG: isochorismatase [Anaerolineales bacterium]|nr:isochorismatase [Anaerolineales bacterium]
MPVPQLPSELPIPPHYDTSKADQVWKVPYEERASQARRWAEDHNISPALSDHFKIELLGVDLQNTFCIPGFELYVGGRTNRGAVEDNQRLVDFVYRNLNVITHVSLTMDTHQAVQIFHAIFLVDSQGNYPSPYTLISAEDIQQGRWKFNPAVADSLGVKPESAQRHLEHYTTELQKNAKYDLTIWPYHAMLGGIGHALVSAVEEAVFFHTIARHSQPDFILKGDNSITEHYSAVGPEVLSNPEGEKIGQKDKRIIQKVVENDVVIIAGQAKSHCVAWTVEDLLAHFQESDPGQLKKIYLLEDCSSLVVVPDMVDYTDHANAAYQRFASSGMNVVKSTDSIMSWLNK